MRSCEHGNENLGSMKVKVFFDLLSDCQLLRKDSTPHSYENKVPVLSVIVYHQTKRALSILLHM
jgi:hypothetical protein